MATMSGNAGVGASAGFEFAQPPSAVPHKRQQHAGETG